jgi:hypothetical protein
VRVTDLPDPDWYLEHVLAYAQPGVDRVVIGPLTEWDEWWRQQAPGSDPLLALARNQGFVVATAQLSAAGWAHHDLRREVRRGTWWVPARGTASPVVVSGDDYQARRRRHAIEAAAANLVRPGKPGERDECGHHARTAHAGPSGSAGADEPRARLARSPLRQSPAARRHRTR